MIWLFPIGKGPRGFAAPYGSPEFLAAYHAATRTELVRDRYLPHAKANKRS